MVVASRCGHTTATRSKRDVRSVVGSVEPRRCRRRSSRWWAFPRAGASTRRSSGDLSQRGQRVTSIPVRRWSSVAQGDGTPSGFDRRSIARGGRCAIGSAVDTCRGANSPLWRILTNPAGQDVQQEAAEELLGMERHRATVLGPKRHGVGGDGDEPLIGEADAVGVAAEVLEESLRAAEGPLHVDEPRGVVERADRAAGGHGIGGRQLATGEAALEGGEHLAAKQRAEDAHGEEMALAGRTPPATVGREPAGRDDAVDVRMKLELPRPGVQHGRDAELGPEPLRIAPEGEEGLGRGSQEIAAPLLTPICCFRTCSTAEDPGDQRQREDVRRLRRRRRGQRDAQIAAAGGTPPGPPPCRAGAPGRRRGSGRRSGSRRHQHGHGSAAGRHHPAGAARLCETPQHNRRFPLARHDDLLFTNDGAPSLAQLPASPGA